MAKLPDDAWTDWLFDPAEREADRAFPGDGDPTGGAAHASIGETLSTENGLFGDLGSAATPVPGIYAADETGTNASSLSPVGYARRAGGGDLAAAHAYSGLGFDPAFTPSDSGFSQQWHLRNTAQPGIDLNLLAVWDDYTGAGIRVALIDDGVDHAHPDLADNYDLNADLDLRGGDADAAPEGADFHGTQVAGVIAAAANGAGLVGVAFDATLAGLRMGFGPDGSLGQIAGALDAAKNFDVVNNSWSFDGYFFDDFDASFFAAIDAEIVDAVADGRDGLGTVIVFSAGNDALDGQNVNYHAFQNSPLTVTVGAIERDGDVAWFSTPGAAVLTSAPGVAIRTTDRVGPAGSVAGDEVVTNGTSFSAPGVAGVAALMLEANPELGYRDVQEILALTSWNPQPNDLVGWQTNGADFWNGGGLTFHDGYGFGLTDAHAAVRLAEVWALQSTFDNLETVVGAASPLAAIPDNGQISSSIGLDTTNFAIDHVLVDVDIDHSFIGDLVVTLTSPAGTVSTLVDRPGLSVDAPAGSGQNDIRFELTSVQFWGEDGDGTWTLNVRDARGGDLGTLENWTLTLVGDEVDAADQYIFTDAWAFLGADVDRRPLVDAAGQDTINFAAFSEDVAFSLEAGAANVVAGHAIELDSGSIFENFIGGDGDDVILGNAEPNRILGMRGADTLQGFGAADILDGGAGDDVLAIADDRFQSLDGGAGHDVLRLAAEGFALDLTGQEDGVIVGIEAIDLAAADTAVIVDRTMALALSDETDVLTVLGGPSTTLRLGDFGWSVVAGDAATQTLANGAAQIVVARDVNVVFPNAEPVVAHPVTAETTEDMAAFQVDLLAGASDADPGDTLAVSGLIRLSGDDAGVTVGAASLTVDPVAYNALAAGESAVVRYGYAVVDGQGGAVAQTATVTITGLNDAPIVAAPVAATATEDAAGFTVDLLAGAGDPDASDALTVSGLALLDGDAAGVTAGAASLIVDPGAYDALAAGESAVVRYNYNVVDGHGGAVAQTATVTITGLNDAPIVAAPVTATATEDAAGFTVDLLAGAGDPDASDALTVSGLALLDGDAAGVTVEATSTSAEATSLSIHPAAYNALAAGESAVVRYGYNVVDGQGGAVAQTATVTITGLNDAPIVAAPVTATATEDAAGFTVDLLAGAGDPDASDALTVSGLTLLDGDAGGVTAGAASLNVDPGAYDALAAGESAVVRYGYNVVDGQGGTVAQTATVTIAGVNDAPHVAAPVAATATEDAAGFTVDLLAGANDPDASDALTVSGLTLLDGDAAGMTAGADSLIVDPGAYDALAAGESAVVRYGYNVVDGQGGAVAQTATVTITGLNDAPIVAAPVAATATEDAAGFTVDLLAGANDPDASDALTVSGLTLLDGDAAGVTAGADSLIVDPAAYDALAAGETAVIRYSYAVIDGQGGAVAQTATVTITGLNDAPHVAAPVIATATEDAAGFTVDLLAEANDPDASDALTVSGLTLLDGDAAGVTVGADSLIVDPGAYDALAAGESAVVRYGYNVVDGQGGAVAQTATVTITGLNDAPIVAAPVTATATEDAAGFTVDLLAGAGDPDASDALTVSGLTLLDGDAGGVTAGAASLNVDPGAYDALAAGESAVVRYGYNVVDGQGGTVAQTATVTIAGVNDAPHVAAPVAATATEDAAGFTVDLLAGANDPDASDALTVSGLTLLDGDAAGMTAGADSLIVDPGAYDALAAGESAVVRYGYSVVDGQGGAVAQTATVTITGLNDAPIVAAPVTATATEDAAGFTVDLLAGANDPDASDALTVSGLTLLDGDAAGVTAGATFLSVDPGVYGALRDGDRAVVRYRYDIVDDQGGATQQTATVTVTGIDEPTDLAAGGFAVDSALWRRGDRIEAGWSISNLGDVAAAVARSGVYLSTDAALGPGDALLAFGLPDAGLPGGGDLAQAAAFSVPDDIAPGLYYLGALADDLGTVDESDEFNNATDLLQVTVAQTPGGLVLQGDAAVNDLGGGWLDDRLSGFGGDDLLRGRGGADMLDGGDGDDRLIGGDGSDRMAGGDGDDIYHVADPGDVVIEMADAGTDRINALVDFVNPANVEFLVGKFADVGLTLTGNSGADRITGSNLIRSGDVIRGAGGNDNLVGLVGDDVIEGGAGNDRIFGNSGHDTIVGGAGNDRVTGQQHADVFVHRPGDGVDRITDFDVNQDLLDLTGHGFETFADVQAAIGDVGAGALIALGREAVLLEGVAGAALGAEDLIL